MDQQNSLEITDKDGWRKVHSFQKRLVHIGSAPQNDIVLEGWRGGGVTSRHLQLIALPAGQGGYRLVNLGDTDVLLGAAGDQVLAPRSATNIADGEHIKLGDFALVLRAGQGFSGAVGGVSTAVASDRERFSGPASAEASSPVIGLELFLPQTQLGPDRPIDGAVIVRNLGDKPGVQFKLAVEGLHADCYAMGAGPLLFPNAEKEVSLRLSHPRGPRLLAGDHRFNVRATAPEAYPGESAAVSQVVHVLPFYKHGLRLVTTE